VGQRAGMTPERRFNAFRQTHGMRNVGPAEPFRELTPRERETLDFLLSVDLPGVAELREQARHALAARSFDDYPTFDLQVDRARAPRSDAPHSRPASSAWAKDADNEWNLLHLLLWVTDGWLVGVEVSDVADADDEPPAEIPPPEFWRSPEAGTGNPSGSA
jgi:hypothetical protein